MLSGNLIDELRELPLDEDHHLALRIIEKRIEDGRLTTEKGLDLCQQVLEDYQKHKVEIEHKVIEESQIIIIDSIMGSGKSTFMINKIIQNPHERFICVLPTLKECERYAIAVKKGLDKDYANQDIIIHEPQPYKGRKGLGLQKLIACGKNIVTTHALIQQIDEVTIELLKKSSYALIIDETLDVVHEYRRKFSKSDMKSIIYDGYAYPDEKGFLVWNSEREQEVFDNQYLGRWSDIKRLCKLKALMCLPKENGDFSKEIVIWNFPVSFFDLFEKSYVCTYLWNGSIQKNYFDLHKVRYLHTTLANNQLCIYNPQKEVTARKRYFDLIDIYQGGMNKIGEPEKHNKHPLCSSWYKNKSKNEIGQAHLAILKNNSSNYFRNIVKTCSKDNMFTTFLEFRKFVRGDGYTKGFVPLNAKGTNDFQHKKSLVYLVNLFPQTVLLHFFRSYDIEINQDLYALAELLQWIWRSRIRNGEKINLYIPSERMRNLLYAWVDGKI